MNSEIDISPKKTDNTLKEQALSIKEQVLKRISFESKNQEAVSGRLSPRNHQAASVGGGGEQTCPLNVEWLSMHPQLPLLILGYSPQLIQASLRTAGFDVCSEIIENLGGEQLLSVLDIDIWKSHQGELMLSSQNIGDWLRAWMEIEPSFAAQKILDFEESFLVYFLNTLIDIKPIGIEYSRLDIDNVPEIDWILTHDKRFNYRIKQEVKNELEDLIYALVEAMYAENFQFTTRVFAYVTMLDKTESFEEATHLRESRLSRIGFVPRFEALDSLTHVGVEAAIKDFQNLRRKKSIENNRKNVGLLKPNTDYLYEEIFDEVVKKLSQMPASESAKQIKLVASEKHLAALVGTVSFTDELLAEDDEVIVDVAEDFCASIASILPIGLKSNSEFFSSWEHSGLFNQYEHKDQIIRLCNLISSCLSPGDFTDVYGHQKFCMEYVKGCVSIGVNILNTQLNMSNEEIRNVYLSQIFQIGWQRIQDARRTVLYKLVSTCKENSLINDFLLNQKVNIPSVKELESLMKSQFIGTLRKRLSDLQLVFTEISPFWDSLVGFLPQRTQFVGVSEPEQFKNSFQKYNVLVSPFQNLQQIEECENFAGRFDVLLAGVFAPSAAQN
jgi:Family of unknown function (DUF6178)